MVLFVCAATGAFENKVLKQLQRTTERKNCLLFIHHHIKSKLLLFAGCQINPEDYSLRFYLEYRATINEHRPPYLPVFFKTRTGGVFFQSYFDFNMLGTSEKLPSTRSIFPSPSISPASIVSHRPVWASGSE